MILLVASLVLLGVAARAIDRFAGAENESRAVRLTRMSLWAAATVVVVEAGLGVCGLLTPGAVLIAFALVAGAASALARRRPRVEAPRRERFSSASVGLLAALVAAFAFQAWTGLHKTTFLYDTLSYHLHVPATWMHDRRVTIVPAVFGDPSSAYAPANLELWFLFLMAPLRSDYLAGIGQLPLAGLAAAAIIATLRDAGASRVTALAGALAFILIPEVWGQIPTAMTDLGFAAFLLASLPFSIRLWNATAPRRADLLTVATAVGLAAGTKYAAATLALPFAALGALAWLRARPLDLRGGAAALALVLATGGFWYVRNAIVTGNPFYPVAVPALPLPALYGRAEMRAWEYHVPVTDLRALGSMWRAAGIGFCGACVVAFARLWRRDVRAATGIRADANHARRWRNIVASLLVATLALFWLVVPYQESRFLFPTLAVATVSIAQGANGSLLALAGLGVASVAPLLEWPTHERLLLAPIGVAAGLVFWRARAPLTRLSARHARLAGAAAALTSLIALGAGARGYAARDPGYAVGDDIDAAWTWFRANVRDARVAYTGNNLAFPLAGERVGNRVTYVNVAGAPGDRLHDFGPPGDGTAEPAPYRRGADADAWIANLRADRAQVLFVAALYPIVRRTIGADRDGFPIERAWADARPGMFHLRYASDAARVYDVNVGAP
jgi:hypothetical protein